MQPKYLNATLRPYQKSGYNWLNQMNDLGFGACLADDMGLGKTLQVISFLEKMYEKKKDGHVLLIVPASLLGNWSKEIDRFAPKKIASFQCFSLWITEPWPIVRC